MARDDFGRARRLHRDPRHGRLMGVCAGVADEFGCNVTLVRIIAVIALFWFGVVTLAAYLVLGVLLPAGVDEDADEAYWRGAGYAAGDRFRERRHRRRELDRNLQHMEGYVTSRRRDLDRQFRDLEH
jgi:phage shock protein C